MITVTKKFEFHAAHFLKDHPGKCKNLHGHSWILEVTVTGKVTKNGIIIDFSVLKEIVENVIICEIDHIFLNERFPLMKDNPTAENIVDWIARTLIPCLRLIDINLVSVKLHESSNSYVEWKPEVIN